MKKQNMKIFLFLSLITFLIAIVQTIAIPFLLQFAPDFHTLGTASEEVRKSAGSGILLMGAVMGDLGIALGIGLIHALVMAAMYASLLAALALIVGGQLFQIGRVARWKQLTGKVLSVIAVVFHVISAVCMSFLFVLNLSIGNMSAHGSIFAVLFILLVCAICGWSVHHVKKIQVLPKQEQQTA